jgi:hypothetical protein
MLSQILAAGLGAIRSAQKSARFASRRTWGSCNSVSTPSVIWHVVEDRGGQLLPTLPTLLKIAMVFGIGLEHFFVDWRDRPTLAVDRKKDRSGLPDHQGVENSRFFLRKTRLPCERSEDGGLLRGVRTAIGSDGAPQTFGRRNTLGDQWSPCCERRRRGHARRFAAITGALFRPGEWYERLRKPSWRPFAPVWTRLCAMMEFSTWVLAGPRVIIKSKVYRFQ